VWSAPLRDVEKRAGSETCLCEGFHLRPLPLRQLREMLRS
jgi:hypothetical protein